MVGRRPHLALPPLGREPLLSMAGEGPSSPCSPWGEDPSCPRWAAAASYVPGGSKYTCPPGVAGKRAALIGEQAVEAGPDRRPRGVKQYSRALTGKPLGLEELRAT